MLTKTKIVLSALAVAGFTQAALAYESNIPELGPQAQRVIVSPGMWQDAGMSAYASADPRDVTVTERLGFDRLTDNIESY